MGGLLIIGSIVVSTLLWARTENPFVWLVLFSTLFLGGIGFYDDWLKVTKKSSKGISSRLKLRLAVRLGGDIHDLLSDEPRLSEIAKQLYIPFLKEPLIFSLGWLTFVFYLLVIVGTSNAVNSPMDSTAWRPDARQLWPPPTPALPISPAMFAPRNTCKFLMSPFRASSPLLQRVAGCLPRVPLVERLPSPRLHGRHWVARHRRNAWCRGHLLQAGTPSRYRGRSIRHRGTVSDLASSQLQDDRPADHQNVADPPPFRT